MDKVEEVARALCKDAGDDPDQDFWDLCGERVKGWTFHARPARAAIAAMREPTPEMIEAGYKACELRMVNTPALAKEVGADSYRAMIDAARGESPT